MRFNTRIGWVFVGLVLLPMLAAAQQDCLKLKNIHASNNALQQGATYEVTLDLESASGDCGFLLEGAGQSVVYPLSIRLDVPLGLLAERTSWRYDKLDDIPGVAMRLTSHLKVTALPELTPGEYNIVAVLSYTAMDNHGATYAQQMTLHVPVKVVPGKSNQQSHDKWWDWLLLIPLVPFWMLKGIADILFDLPEC